jgi:hypothetical protein
MGRKRKHHEIPEYYLRGFCEPGTSFVWTFDKIRPFLPGAKRGVNNPVRSGVRLTALREDEYLARTPMGKKHYEFESKLQRKEHLADSAIRKVCAFQPIMDSDKKILAAYVFLMLKRVTKRDREMRVNVKTALNRMTTAQRAQAKRSGRGVEESNRLMKEIGFWDSEDGVTDALRRTMVEDVGLVHGVLSARTWEFVKPSPGEFFVTSDNPVVFDKALGLERATLIFPLSQRVILVTDGSNDLAYRTASSEEVRKYNALIVVTAEREVYAPQPEEWIHIGWTKGFTF